MIAYGFKEKVDFTEATFIHPQNKQPTKDYLLSLNMAKDICRKQRRNSIAADLYCSLEKHTNGKEVIYVEPTRLEISFKSVLSQVTKEFGFQYITQYNSNGFRIDFYFAEQKLAVEYDEFQHYTKRNIKMDSRRQLAIERQLQCTFIRLDYKDSDISNALKVLKTLLKIKGEIK